MLHILLLAVFGSLVMKLVLTHHHLLLVWVQFGCSIRCSSNITVAWPWTYSARPLLTSGTRVLSKLEVYLPLSIFIVLANWHLCCLSICYSYSSQKKGAHHFWAIHLATIHPSYLCLHVGRWKSPIISVRYTNTSCAGALWLWNHLFASLSTWLQHRRWAAAGRYWTMVFT